MHRTLWAKYVLHVSHLGCDPVTFMTALKSLFQVSAMIFLAVFWVYPADPGRNVALWLQFSAE